jgi:predicted DNA-binding transcriptional regulator AlpA
MDTTSERLLLSVPQAAALAGLSKTVAYRLAALDELPGLVKLTGCRLMVRRRVLVAWLGGQEPFHLPQTRVPAPATPRRSTGGTRKGSVKLSARGPPGDARRPAGRE